MANSPAFEILREARQGSPEAASALVERYGGRLHALIRARLGARLRRRLESRDILQATLMRAFHGLHRFDGEGSGSFIAWLGAVAQAEICDQADFHRRRRRELAREETLDSRLDVVDRQVRSEVSRLQLARDLERLAEAVDGLAGDQREVVLLRSFEELPFKEVGVRMGRSADACRMLYARALAKLALRI